MTEPTPRINATDAEYLTRATALAMGVVTATDRTGADEAMRRLAQFSENGMPEAGAPTPSTWRTLADIDDSPPGDLLLDMLEPDGPTMLYGPGGLGKGMTIAWMISELVELGIRPLIYDAENRPKEWARRTSGLGVDRGKVVYVQPSELPTELRGEPLWTVAPHLGRIADAAGCGIVFVDSVLAAMNVSEDRLRGDAGAPYEFVAALDRLERPSVCAGHTPKGSPDGDPYGSVSWVNAMRFLWHGSTAAGDGHRVRWRPRKKNERGHIATVQLVFLYGEDNRPRKVEKLEDELVVRDWITSQLMDLAEATVADLAEEMIIDDDGNRALALERAKDTISRTLRRMKKAGQVHIRKASRPARWALGDGR
jgi:hypothetical protein